VGKGVLNKYEGVVVIKYVMCAVVASSIDRSLAEEASGSVEDKEGH
jgi:hypothetical protein